MLRHLLTLARVSNLPTVWSNCLAAWLLSGRTPDLTLLPLLAGTSLLYAGGCTLNDAFDARWDAARRPDRLIPSGTLRRSTVWAAGFAELLAGLALTAAGGPALPAAAALCAAILFYDAWHKQSPWSVVTMGACRWLLYLTAAAGAASLTPAAVSGAVVWLYIIVLSLVARGEACRGEAIPRSRWLLLALPAAITAAAFLLGLRGPAAALPALALAAGAALILPRGKVTTGVWVNRLLAAIPWLDFSLCLIPCLAPAGPGTALFWLPAFPAATGLCLLFQRRFKAT